LQNILNLDGSDNTKFKLATPYAHWQTL